MGNTDDQNISGSSSRLIVRSNIRSAKPRTFASPVSQREHTPHPADDFVMTNGEPPNPAVLFLKLLENVSRNIEEMCDILNVWDYESSYHLVELSPEFHVVDWSVVIDLLITDIVHQIKGHNFELNDHFDFLNLYVPRDIIPPHHSIHTIIYMQYYALRCSSQYKKDTVKYV